MFNDSITYKLPTKHKMPVLTETIRTIEDNCFVSDEYVVPVYHVDELDEGYFEIEANGEWFYIQERENNRTLLLGIIDEEADGTYEDHLEYCDGRECENSDGEECYPRVGEMYSDAWNMLDKILTKLGYEKE